MNPEPIIKIDLPESPHRSYSRPLFLFIFACVYLYPFVKVLWRVGDEGSLVYGAQLVAEGYMPYRDFFEVMGPGAFYWLSFFFRVFGTEFAVARSLLLLTGVATTLLVYWLTRRLYRGTFDMLPALFYLVMGIPLWPANSHHWDSNLFALLAVSSFLLWRGSQSIKFLSASCFLAAITSCFMLQKGILLLTSFVLVELVDSYWRWKSVRDVVLHLGIASGSFASVVLAVVLYFHWAGSLNDMIYALWVWPLTQYHNVNIVPYGYGFRQYFWPLWSSVLQFFFPPWAAAMLCVLFSVPLGIVVALPFLVALSAAVSWTSASCIFNSKTLVYWLAGVALWISEAHRLAVEHLIFGSPLLLILFITISTARKKFSWQIGLSFVGLTLVLVGTFNVWRASAASYKLDTRRGTVRSFMEDDALRFLNTQIQAGQEVFIYPYQPMYYFLANVKNPSRYSILMYHINTDAQFMETLAALEEKKVRHVFWDTLVEGANLRIWFPNYTHPPIEQLHLEHYFDTHYRVVEVRNGFRILQRVDG